MRERTRLFRSSLMVAYYQDTIAAPVNSRLTNYLLITRNRPFRVGLQAGITCGHKISDDEKLNEK